MDGRFRLNHVYAYRRSIYWVTKINTTVSGVKTARVTWIHDPRKNGKSPTGRYFDDIDERSPVAYDSEDLGSYNAKSIKTWVTLYG